MAEKTVGIAHELSGVERKLDLIARLLGALAVKGMRQRDQIALLSQAGLAPREIAEWIGTSANTVRVELVAIRKESKKSNRKLDKGGDE